MALAGETRRDKPQDEQEKVSGLSCFPKQEGPPQHWAETGEEIGCGAPTLPHGLRRALHQPQAAPAQPGSAFIARSQTLHGTKPALPAAALPPRLRQDEAPADCPPPPRDVLTASTAQHDCEWPGRGTGVNLQMEILLPDWVEIAIDSFSPFLCFPNLDSDIRVTGTRLILCLQALGTNDCSTAQHKCPSTRDVYGT